MSPKHDTTKVRIHSSTKRTTAGREFRQFNVRWYQDGKRKQRCFTTLAEAKAWKLEVERNPGGVWVSFEFKQSTVDKLNEVAKRLDLSVGELLCKVIKRGSELGWIDRVIAESKAKENGGAK